MTSNSRDGEFLSIDGVDGSVLIGFSDDNSLIFSFSNVGGFVLSGIAGGSCSSDDSSASDEDDDDDSGEERRRR